MATIFTYYPIPKIDFYRNDLTLVFSGRVKTLWRHLHPCEKNEVSSASKISFCRSDYKNEKQFNRHSNKQNLTQLRGILIGFPVCPTTASLTGFTQTWNQNRSHQKLTQIHHVLQHSPAVSLINKHTALGIDTLWNDKLLSAKLFKSVRYPTITNDNFCMGKLSFRFPGLPGH